MATEHICSCLLFFGVKLLAKIWDISHCSLHKQKKSDGVRCFSWDVYPVFFRKVQIYFACGLSSLPLKRKLWGCIQEPWLLFWNHFAAVWLHDRQGNSLWWNPITRKAGPERLCVCSQSHLSCGQHFAPEEISQSGCLNNIVKIIHYHPAGERGQSLSCFFPLWVILCLLVLAWASSEIIFLASLEEKQCKKIHFFHWLKQVGSTHGKAKLIWRHHEGQSRICNW